MTTAQHGPPRHVAGVTGAAVIALAAVACSGEDPAPVGDGTNPPPIVVEGPDDTGTGAAGPTTDPPTDAPTGAPTVEDVDPAAPPPFQTPGTPQVSEASGEPMLPVDLHVGDHDGYDRIVVELAGDGVPGWRTEYVTEAVGAGRGERIDVDADAVLGVEITGTRYPDEGEDHYAPRGPVDGEDLVEEVHYVGTFEGVTQLFIGVDDGPAAYRVFPLVRPARLVIDIADPGD